MEIPTTDEIDANAGDSEGATDNSGAAAEAEGNVEEDIADAEVEESSAAAATFTVATAALMAEGLAGSEEPVAASEDSALIGEELGRRDIIKQSRLLKSLTVALPDGRSARYLTLSAFVIGEPRFAFQGDGLIDKATQTVYSPNYETGFFETSSGDQLTTFFRINIYFSNFVRTFTDKNSRVHLFKFLSGPSFLPC